MLSINKFLIEKGIKSNTEKITILQMVRWVDEWQEELKKTQSNHLFCECTPTGTLEMNTIVTCKTCNKEVKTFKY